MPAGRSGRWANDTSEVHGVTFLAGQPLPPIPDWYFSSPTGNGVAYDGSTYFNSGLLGGAMAGLLVAWQVLHGRPKGRVSWSDPG